jgi:hypothetical protein
MCGGEQQMLAIDFTSHADLPPIRRRKADQPPSRSGMLGIGGMVVDHEAHSIRSAASDVSRMPRCDAHPFLGHVHGQYLGSFKNIDRS